MATLSDLIVKLGIDASNYTEGISKATADLNTFAGSISERIKTAGDGLKSLGRDLQSLGGSITVGVTAPILAAFGSTTKMAGDFELAMRRVTSLLGDVTQPEFKALSEDTLELSKKLGIDAVGAANGLYEAISAGVPKENALTFLSVASEAAIAGVTNTKVAVDGLTNIMNAFGISMDQTRTVADAMFQAVNIGKFTFEELAGSVGTASGTAAQLGVDFREMLAAAATITKQGFDVTEALTQIQRAMLSIISPNKQMNELLEKTGFSTGQALINAKGFEGALNALRDAAGGNIQVLTDAYGRVEGLKASLALTGDKAKMAAADLNVLKSSAGATASAFQQIDQSLPRQWERFTNEAKFLAIEFGDSLLPTAKNLLGVFRELNESVLAPALQVFTALPQPVKDVAVAIGLAVAAIGPLIVAFGTAVWSLGQIKVAFAAIQALQLAPMFANIAFAVSNNLVGALSSGETMLLRFGQAGLIAGAAFAGWKLGEWLQSFTTEYKEAEKKVQQLSDSLKEQGVVIERGGKSLKDWAAEVFKADEAIKHKTKSTKDAKTADEKLQQSLENLLKGGIKPNIKGTEEHTKKLDDWAEMMKRGRENSEKQRTELFKLSVETIKAREATDRFRETAGRTTPELARMADRISEMVDAEAAFTGSSVTLIQALDKIGGTRPAIDSLGAAFERLGITTSTSVRKSAEQALKDYETIRDSGVATVREITEAWLASERAQIQASRDKGEAVDAEYEKVLDEVEASIKGTTKVTETEVGKQETIWGGLKNQVSTIFTDLSKGISDVIFEGKGIGEMFKGIFEEGGKAVLRFVVEYLEGKLFAALGKLVDEIIPGVAKALGGMFGGAGGAAGDVAGGVAGGAGDAAGGAAGGVGGAVGQGVGQGVSGVVGAVSGVVSAVSSVIGNFQMAHMETSLNAIEHNTRYTMMYVGERADGGILGVLFKIAETLAWGPAVKAVEAIRDEVRGLGASYINPSLDTIKTDLHSLLLASGGGTASENPSAGILAEIRDELVKFGGSYFNPSLDTIKTAVSDTFALLRDVTNAHLAAIQESVAVLPQAYAAGATGAGNITINLTLDVQKVSEVVIDNMGRQLNQSGQILR